ncbi:MAG: SMC-Scp complex subunit ScpB [Dehalococcoidia bacterium]|nr:SMC-Scp complex subunit ScpB [Dehalococcoidia bacterium]
MPQRLPPANSERLSAIIESILFVAEEPVDVGVLAQTLHRPEDDVELALMDLAERCEEGGTRLQRTGELVQLVTAPECGPYVERFLGLEYRQRLSSATLETLAIVAYKQPVTRAAVEAVRGVNSDGAIASLIARGLVEEVGKAPGPGRPSLLGTTIKFLEHFGLKDPTDLPPLGIGNGVTAIADAVDAEDAGHDEEEDEALEEAVTAE